ncbi:MAG: galactokinase [Bacilli bacterium]|nr:galactokinase [Bacilli bacterium]
MNLEQEFYNVFKSAPTLSYKAPARINLIGEHIDYNGGRVLPCAISSYIRAFVSKRDDDIISAHSLNIRTTHSIHLSQIQYDKENDWCNYVFGIFYVLRQMGYSIPHGLNILINSEIPVGSGLSSSAALLVLICYIANDIYDLKINLKNIAKIAVKCENEFCGLKCGIMDEAAIALGLRNKCLLLDCSKFEYEYIDLDLGKYAFVVLKTNKPRALVESKYNKRVEECEKGLAILKEHYQIDNLCQLNVEELDNVRKLIKDDIIYKRVKHVISENDRVYEFVRALNKRDMHMLSTLLDASHQSLKEDYEVTGIHLDTIVDAAKAAGALGARMTGAGFGGCAIALIDRSTFIEFKEKVEEYYFQKLNIMPEVFSIDIVDGPSHEYDF